jgi:hypothetical protein
LLNTYIGYHMKLTLLTCLLIPALAIAQKQTSLVLYLPEHIQKEKLDITFYDGKSDKTIHVKSDSNVFVRYRRCI